MNTVVITLNQTAICELVRQLAPHRVANNNAYVTFAAKYRGVTILAYTSGKVVFQGSEAEALAQELGYQEVNPKAKVLSGQNGLLIGSDEVGNGSYFGGIAVVASFVTPEDHAWLKSIGVDDSKTLNDTKILQIAPLLEERIPHKALLLTPKKYNEVVGPGKSYNAVSVKVALHNQAIYLLLQEVATPDKIVIDAFTSQQNYEKYLNQEKNHLQNPLTFEEKAEGKYLAVAVSSIIARKLFLENLKQLSNETGYDLPSGAGAKSDQVAAKLLEAYGMEALIHTAKLHFANTQKAQKIYSQRKSS